MAVADWSGQDWAFALGGVAVVVTSLGTFIVQVWGLRGLNKKIDGMLVQRDASNVADGERIGRQAGDEASAQRAEGRREQREIQTHRDAAAAALAPNQNGAPVPVKDDQAAEIAERNTKATESIADSAKEANVLAKKE